jgi:hypothetical protein
MRQHDRIEKRIFISDSFGKISEKVKPPALKGGASR